MLANQGGSGKAQATNEQVDQKSSKQKGLNPVENPVDLVKTMATLGQQTANLASGKDYIYNTPGEVGVYAMASLKKMESQNGGFSNMSYENQQRAMTLATAKHAATSLIVAGIDPTAEIDDLTMPDAQTLRDLGFGTEAQTQYNVDISTSQSKNDRRTARASSTPEVDTSVAERNQASLEYGDDTLSK